MGVPACAGAVAGMSQVNLGLGDGARWFYLTVLRLNLDASLHPELAYFHPLVEAAWPGVS